MEFILLLMIFKSPTSEFPNETLCASTFDITNPFKFELINLEPWKDVPSKLDFLRSTLSNVETEIFEC